jgi:thiol:disulfide interchange protein DsbA
MRRFPPALFLLLCLALLPGLAWSATPAAAVEGRDYALIEGGAPWQPLKGRIEVVEVFAYWCDHCGRFQPMVDAWKRTLAKDVRLSYLPLPSDGDDTFARGFFATQDAGALAKVHAPLYLAVHQQQSVPKNPSIDELASWYGQQGLKPARLKTAMQAPAMAARLTAAREFALRSGVEGTPSLVINGRYRILGRSYQELLRNADAVIVQLRAAAP